MKKVLLFLSLMVFLSVGKMMAQKKPFTIADIYKVHNVGSPVLSPDGSRIAYPVSSYDMKKGES